MGLYEEWSAQDLLGPIFEDIKERRVILNGNKIVIPDSLGCDTPWLHTRIAEDRRCKIWEIYFRLYGLVPQKCQCCFKVVVRLKTLRDLFKMREVQKELNYYSKCGLEIRDFVPALYGAYWYCPIDGGLEGARQRYQEVKTAVHENFGPDTPVILKRGCTEMELAKGPSDQWVYTEGDRRLEMKLDSMFEIDESFEKLPTHVEHHILRKWVRFAFERGDETYKDFIDHPLVRPVVTYHDSKHGEDDLKWPDKTSPANQKKS